MSTFVVRSFRPGHPRGQSVVEFAMVLPFLMMVILGAIEFGFMFNHHLTLEYASREGARVGSSLVNGGGTLGCGAGQSPNWATVDTKIVAAIERVLDSTGSPIDLSRVSEIRIFKADAAGNQIGTNANAWTYTPGTGPVVDGTPLNFSPPSSNAWQACARNNFQPADSIGVSLSYSYRLQTPFLSFTGFSSLPMSDRTVMALNPSSQ